MIEIFTLLILLGLCALISGFSIITFIVVTLFFKKEVVLREKNKFILSFELFITFCGWLAIAFLILTLPIWV